MATWAEHDGIVLTHYGRNTVFMGPMNKALQVGECKSDMEMNRVHNPRQAGQGADQQKLRCFHPLYFWTVSEFWL